MILAPLLTAAKALDIKTWIIIGLSAAIVAMWLTIQFKNASVDSLKNEVDKKEVIISQYKNEVNSLIEAVEKQNDAIEGLQARNSEFAATLDNASAQNARMANEANRLIAMIKNSKVPADCQGATNHLSTFTKDFGKTWNSGQ